jgi:hypothetical protein
MAFQKQTHCKRGHPMVPDNLYWDKKENGTVRGVCLTCRTARLNKLRKTNSPQGVHYLGGRDRCSYGHIYAEGTFKIVNDGRGKPYRLCKICSRLRVKASHQKAYYGLTSEQRNQRFIEQGYCCAVCETQNPKGRNWNTDHDHHNNKARGVLCSPCNMALGCIDDNIDTLYRLIEYLKKWKRIHQDEERNSDDQFGKNFGHDGVGEEVFVQPPISNR